MSLNNLPPVRCFTCRSPKIGFKFKSFLQHMKHAPNATALDYFNKNGIDRYCCRRMFVGYMEFIAAQGSGSCFVDDVQRLKDR